MSLAKGENRSQNARFEVTMKRRKFDSKTKWLIVLEGLKGKPVAEICNNHQICQSQYYTWRDQVLSNSSKAFEANKQCKREQYLEKQIRQLKTVIGDLTIELKKNDEEWFD